MKRLLLVLILIASSAHAVPERICIDDESPGRIWIGGQWVSGSEMDAPFGMQNAFEVDRCIQAEIPRLVAFSKTLQSLPEICEKPEPCEYDLDADGSVGLGDISFLIAKGLSQLGEVCRENDQ